MSTDPKRDGDGLRDGDKRQGDLRNAPHADRALPEGLKRERKGRLIKTRGEKITLPTSQSSNRGSQAAAIRSPKIRWEPIVNSGGS